MKKLKIISMALVLSISIPLLTSVTAEATVTSGWAKDNKGWVYNDSKGNHQKGWIKVADKWYFMDNSGAMKTGWVKDNNKWYFINGSGEMKTGWIKDDGKWYFMDNSGAMKTGWVTFGEDRYYFEENGQMHIFGVIDGYTITTSGLAVKEFNQDIAMRVLKYNDGIYLNEKLKNGAELTNIHKVTAGEVNDLINCWGIMREDCFQFDLKDKNGIINKYLVSIPYGRVYRLSTQKTDPILLLMDNKVDTKYEYLNDEKAKQAEDIVLKADGIFIKSVMDKDKSLKLGRAIFSIGSLENFGVPKEKFIQIALEDDHLDCCIYFVSLESGNVYKAYHGGGPLELVKDNKVIKKFDYIK